MGASVEDLERDMEEASVACQTCARFDHLRGYFEKYAEMQSNGNGRGLLWFHEWLKRHTDYDLGKTALHSHMKHLGDKNG